ncbi:MAG: DNA-formamidopyrimidine glycosylase [Candidatus Liptonbacteria bacterium]|nr:DNA-formamidopyrimidine glycosylase [Candidatus Liptonbacteria bacterium]
MPELPEVETVVRDLQKRVVGRKILDVWTDWPKYFRGTSLKVFKRHVRGKKILGVSRRGKNILIEVSDPPSRKRSGRASSHLILVHLKMTGHLLAGKWQRAKGKLQISKQEWRPDGKVKEMHDPKNGFIRLVFFLDSKQYPMLALSDMRRFAKVLCGPKEKILNLPDLKNLGPEALEISYQEFRDKFKVKKGKIKQVLLDQSFVVGIGNIYSDEILYVAKIHPLSRVEKLKEPHIKALYLAMKKILAKGIKMRGTSSDDFRDTYGKKGNYGNVILTYQRHGEKCSLGHLIHRIKVAQRSAHFCPVCQKLIQ